MQPTPYEELEKVHFLCFKRAQSANFLISRPILQLQEIPQLEGVGNDDENDITGVENFAIGDRWLSLFKKPHWPCLQNYVR